MHARGGVTEGCHVRHKGGGGRRFERCYMDEKWYKWNLNTN